MSRLLISLITLLLIALAAWGLAWVDQAYVVEMTPIRVEAELPGFTLSALSLGGVLALAVALALMGGRVWQFFAALPGRLRERRQANRKERGYVALTKGLAAVAAGDAKESAFMASTSKSLLKDQKLTALLTAQSAQLQGREDLAKEEFKSLLEDEETAFLGLRGLAMQALRQDREVEALRHVKAAQALRPSAPWVLDLLHRLELRDGNIPGCIAALEAGKVHGLMSAEEARGRLAPLYAQEAQTALDAGHVEAALNFSAQALDQNYTYLPASLIRARTLIAAGQLAQARSLIARQWSKLPHPELPGLYVKASEAQDDPKKARKAGLTLLKNNDGSRAAQLALGEFLLRNLDVVGASVALEAAQAKGSPRAIRLLDLVPRLTLILEDSEAGENGAARQERALALIDAALAGPLDSEWVCASCGTPHGTWHLTCGSCNLSGTIEWQERDRRRVVRPDEVPLARALPSSLG